MADLGTSEVHRRASIHSNNFPIRRAFLEPVTAAAGPDCSLHEFLSPYVEIVNSSVCHDHGTGDMSLVGVLQDA